MVNLTLISISLLTRTIPLVVAVQHFMIRFGFYLLLIAMPVDLLAQEFTPDPDWRFENFNSQNHFISRAISDLTIDKNNYVWTSNSGVQRFDGHKNNRNLTVLMKTRPHLGQTIPTWLLIMMAVFG